MMIRALFACLGKEREREGVGDRKDGRERGREGNKEMEGGEEGREGERDRSDGEGETEGMKEKHLGEDRICILV